MVCELSTAVLELVITNGKRSGAFLRGPGTAEAYALTEAFNF